MWLKKIFKRSQSSQQPPKGRNSENMQQDPETIESTMHTAPEKEIDLRYSQLRIINNNKLHLPKNHIHVIQSAFFEDQEYLQAKIKYSQQWVNVQATITDKQIVFIPDFFKVSQDCIRDNNVLHICYGIVQKIEYIQVRKQTPKLYFTLKDSRGFYIQSSMADKLKQIEKIIRQFAFPNGVNKFYSFKYAKGNHRVYKVNRHISGWDIYDFHKEIGRMGLNQFIVKEGENNNKIEKVYRVIVNNQFQLSPTYSDKFIVPAEMNQQSLFRCSKFRTKERLPILTYFYQYRPKSFVSLFRCSQIKSGLLYNRCPEDEAMIQSISNATTKISNHIVTDPKARINCKIYDARGYYAAWGNKLAGKGFQSQQFYNCEVQFLDIPNIHAVRESYHRVKGYNPYKEDSIVALGQSGWIDYLFLILAGAKSMVKTLQTGKNVIVHCSDGWDRTTQLSCLAQILIDPYYRTIQGFIVLFEKDWRHCGHKFRERSGQYNHIDYHPRQTSPIFIQYLDCILQIMTQFPLSFQFNIKLLNFLAQAYQSYIYGTFLTNNIKESKMINLEERTVSVWSDILEDRQKYINLFYRSDGPRVLDIDVSGVNFAIWKEWLFEEKSLKYKEYEHYHRKMVINLEMKEQIRRQQLEIEQLQRKLSDQSKNHQQNKQQ